MKISRNWLQTYFENPLPSTEVLSDALTFHAFEIDGVDRVNFAGRPDDVLDVKITPNRGHDCLSHLGVAKELSAILKFPLAGVSSDLSTRSLEPKLGELGKGSSETLQPQVKPAVRVTLQTSLCRRYVAGHIKNVTVGPLPDTELGRRIKHGLEAVGQRSINNIVDATNYVMFDLGQPLHAFAAEKLVAEPIRRGLTSAEENTYAIAVRAAKDGECLLALDDKSYTLNSSNIVIADDNTGEAIGIAGVKGGKPAGVSESTKEIIIESANFDGVSVRKTAQALKLRTDASARFEQQLSPELAGTAMQAVVDLILQLSPGAEVVGFVDVYPHPQEKKTVSVTTTQVAAVLGDTFGEKEITDSFDRLGFVYKKETTSATDGKKADTVFTVSVPPERLDITIAEDLIEEVGRIQGYDKVPAVALPAFSKSIEINKNFYWSEKIREYLVSQGFSEVFTSVFADHGERIVLNKVDGVKPYLRSNLADGLAAALEKNIHNKELLGLSQIKLFEIGTVWKGGKEEIVYDIAVEKVKKGKTAEEYKTELDAFVATISDAPTHYDDAPLSTTERYQSFSKYPYIVRDVAFWTPAETDDKKIEEIIKKEAGELCVKISLFDKFEKAAKDGAPAKTSLAFRLIFQSFDRTLTDDDANAAMEKVYSKLKAEGFEIR